MVAFTTLQTRLFLPISSLLNVAVDVQTSTALFDRVFEYLDLPVDIHPGTRRLGAVAGEVRFEDVVLPLRRGAWTLRDIDLEVPAGHAHRDRRRDRVGQDHARLPRRAPLRPGARAPC